MKLFQIEEPEGGPSGPDVPGVAIGVDLSGAAGVVAVAVGGNAVVLSDRDGFEQDLSVPSQNAGPDEWEELFARARLRAERGLARPATHAVVIVTAGQAATAPLLSNAAERAGLRVLQLLPVTELQPGTAPALAAALLAEDLAPRPDPGGTLGASFA